MEFLSYLYGGGGVYKKVYNKLDSRMWINLT